MLRKLGEDVAVERLPKPQQERNLTLFHVLFPQFVASFQRFVNNPDIKPPLRYIAGWAVG